MCAITFPDVFIPFQRAKYTIIKTAMRHSAICHLIIPTLLRFGSSSSTPLLKNEAKTLKTQVNDRDVLSKRCRFPLKTKTMIKCCYSTKHRLLERF